MKFKTFFFEQTGLGNIGGSFQKIFGSPHVANKFNGYFSSDDMDGSDQNVTMGLNGHHTSLPTPDLVIPSMERSGKITVLLKNRNPIHVRLSDGTQANFTYDEFRRIKGNPEVGKNMTIRFQRHEKDASGNHSKIDSAEVSPS